MKGFKTILFGLIVVLLGPITEYFKGIQEALGQCATVTTETAASVTEICNAGLPSWAVSAIGGLILLLRLLTSTSVFKK